MARYIDADKLIEHLKDEIKACEPVFNGRANGKSVAYGTELGLKSAISFAETLATADVAPKSEVAREIFEEIELFLKKAIDGWRKERKFAYNDRQIEMIDFRNGAFKYCLHEIAELKKKYTEGEG